MTAYWIVAGGYLLALAAKILKNSARQASHILDLVAYAVLFIAYLFFAISGAH